MSSLLLPAPHAPIPCRRRSCISATAVSTRAALLAARRSLREALRALARRAAAQARAWGRVPGTAAASSHAASSVLDFFDFFFGGVGVNEKNFLSLSISLFQYLFLLSLYLASDHQGPPGRPSARSRPRRRPRRGRPGMLVRCYCFFCVCGGRG